MIKPLIWKEWHEQRWKLAFGTVMLVFFTGALLAARVSTDREIVVVVWFFGGLVLSLYSAMGVFAPERTGGTTTFLVSKPIAVWKVFICKWFFGWLNFAVPMLVCGTVLVVIALLHPEGRLFELKYIAKGTFTVLCMATAFYSMTCCFAPRKSSEAFVGFVGLLVFFVVLIHLFLSQFHAFGLIRLGKEFRIIDDIMLFINPLYLMSFIEHNSWVEHTAILWIVQTIIFLFVLWVGLRKWQRRS